MPWTPPRKHVPSDEEVWNTLPSRKNKLFSISIAPCDGVMTEEEFEKLMPPNFIGENRYGTAPYDTTKLSNDHCNTFHDNMFAKMVQRESNFFKIIENY